jgi:hypothetical protein
MNCGVTEFEGDVLLLLRVAETPINRDPNIVMAPYFNEATGKVEVKTFDAHDETIDFSDPRVIEARDYRNRRIWRLFKRITSYRRAWNGFSYYLQSNGE